MSTKTIHQTMVKTLKKPVNFYWLFTFVPMDRCAGILASLFIWFQIKSNTMLCCLADDPKAVAENIVNQFEEIVGNFEIIKKRPSGY